MTVLFDTCIVIDVLQKRTPFCDQAMCLLEAVSDRKIKGVLTAKSITDIYYLMRKNLHNEEQARTLLDKLFLLFDIADTCRSDCRNALLSAVTDYEDAVMIQTAKRINADCIVTRNIKDYQPSDVPVYLPEELLRLP